MDSQTKSAIKQLVLDLRHTLEDELTIALKRYGIFTDRKWPLDEPPERLTDPRDREIWLRIVAVVRRGLKEGRTLPQASQDYVRESAFTFLNRLVGLKCLEVRGIIDEVITTRDIYGGRSKAHRDYRDEHPREARAADDALPACLEEACRRVNDELIGYLFDPDDDHSLVWPRYAVLKGCIEKINALDEVVWREDEIIGWIYQFYNAEEKVAIRKRGKPRTPHDVAVINQFFTPRWICKFLVDNTLGRLWLEMHPESPRVREKCDYLVPELLPAAEAEDEGYALNPDSPISNPKAPPSREEKPITQIRLLDPACGTMHFGHYACEVFDAMYRDARDRGEVEISDQRIPGAILEYNLYGVDIDRRAVQLAALSLFMKATTMHPQARVQQVNLVVADATMPDSGVKKRFLARYAHDPRLQKAVAQVLDDLDNVAQVGSLLRVEERLRELLARAGHAAATAQFDMRRQWDLPGMEVAARQMGLAEIAAGDQAAAWTPHTTLQELRDDLRAFARQALQEHDVNAQLFATEAQKTVHLLDVLLDDYDVVVMNPPYGSTTDTARERIHRDYPESGGDLYAASMSQALRIIVPHGYLGALTSRTFLTLAAFEAFREHLLFHFIPVLFFDLGFGVLDDAAVETCVSVIQKGNGTPRPAHEVIFAVGDGTHAEEWARGLGCKAIPITKLRSIPGYQFAYRAPAVLLDRYIESKRRFTDLVHAKMGLGTGKDALFVRYRWEVAGPSLSRNWRPFAKGGDFCRYYSDVIWAVDWTNDGRPMQEFPGCRRRGEDYYLQGGITWPWLTVKGFNARVLPAQTMFANISPLAPFPEVNEPVQKLANEGVERPAKAQLFALLGYLNSEAVSAFLDLITPSRNYTVGQVNALPVVLEVLTSRTLSVAAHRAFSIKALWDSGNELCSLFDIPWLMQSYQGTLLAGHPDLHPAVQPSSGLAALLEHVCAVERAADARLQALQAEIDEAVYDLHEISPADRALIKRKLGERPPELVWPQMERKSDREKRREHVRRFFSYYALQAVHGDADGIVSLAGGASREPTLVDRVRVQLEAQFGPQVAYQFEQDATEYLGRSLEEWLHRYFFHQFHAKLYKNRPILWHLASPKGYFAVLVDYHQLTRDTLPKVQTLYLWPQIEAVRTRLAAARTHEASLKEIADLEDELADLEDCNTRLEQVIQGTVKVDLPDWAVGPYRNGKPPYDPELDDGVKVNLLPLQEAGLLPMKKVV